MREFEVEISRPGEFGILTSSTLELPATWVEYQDAMEKARITDDRVIYEVELCGTRWSCLENRIPAPIYLPELNLLAQRLAGLSSQQNAIFDAMVSIEAKQSKRNTIPLPRLINFTYSLDNCRVAPGYAATKPSAGGFLRMVCCRRRYMTLPRPGFFGEVKRRMNASA